MLLLNHYFPCVLRTFCFPVTSLDMATFNYDVGQGNCPCLQLVYLVAVLWYGRMQRKKERGGGLAVHFVGPSCLEPPNAFLDP